MPPATAFGKRSVTLGTTALEQAAVAEVTRDVAGTGVCNRFVRLSPGSRPGVEAPLGWVLSAASKRSLREGLAAARRRGRVGGRPPALSPEQKAEVRRLRDEDRRSIAELARLFRVSQNTIRRA